MLGVGLADEGGVLDAPDVGEIVIVTVGAGLGELGRRESRGSRSGIATTMPTTSSPEKSTKGCTMAIRVSDPVAPLMSVIVPNGIPGRNGCLFFEPKESSESPFFKGAIGSSNWNVKPASPSPVAMPICEDLAARAPIEEDGSMASKTVDVLRPTLLTRPTRPSPLITH